MLAAQRLEDPAPAWLALVPTAERQMLLSLIWSAGRSREETAKHMLHAGPWPHDEQDACDRVRAVITFLHQ